MPGTHWQSTGDSRETMNRQRILFRVWFRQGMQVTISGRIQTGSYTNREGRKVYTTEVVLEEQEFAESKRDGNAPAPQPADAGDGFMNIPDGIDDNIPFN